MRVEKVDMDYYINISKGEGNTISKRLTGGIFDYGFYYP